jgi:hypothetical protein
MPRLIPGRGEHPGNSARNGDKQWGFSPFLDNIGEYPHFGVDGDSARIRGRCGEFIPVPALLDLGGA